MMSPRARLGLLLIILLAGGLRSGIGLSRQGEVFRWPDSQGNLAIARNVVDGKGFQHTVQVGDTERRLMADRTPGYPLVLAGLVRFFGHWPAAAVVVLQALVAMVGVYLVFLLGRDVAGPIAGMAAAVILAVHPWQVYFSTVALTEVWSLALVTGLVLCSLRADAKGSPAWTVAAGLCLAALVYFNPAYLLLPLAVLAGLFFGQHRRRRLLMWVVVVVIMALALVPWSLRNYHQLGRAVLGTTRLGPTLYDSLRPLSDGGSDMRFEAALSEETKPLDETAYDAYYRERSMTVVRQEPGRVAHLAWLKFLRTWSPVPNIAEARASAPYWWASLVSYIFVMGGASLGFIVLTRQAGHLWMLVAPVLYVTLLHVVIVGSVRYRLPIEPLLYVMAGCALAWVVRGAPEGQLNDRPVKRR